MQHVSADKLNGICQGLRQHFSTLSYKFRLEAREELRRGGEDHVGKCRLALILCVQEDGVSRDISPNILVESVSGRAKTRNEHGAFSAREKLVREQAHTHARTHAHTHHPLHTQSAYLNREDLSAA